jgi:hypothetical protein
VARGRFEAQERPARSGVVRPLESQYTMKDILHGRMTGCSMRRTGWLSGFLSSSLYYLPSLHAVPPARALERSAS